MGKKTNIFQRISKKARRLLHRPSIQKLALSVLGESSTAVVDIGARWGASDAWWRLNPLARLIGFDPDSKECSRLNALVPKGRNDFFYPAVLGKSAGPATLHVAHQPACSSLYPPIQEVVERYPNCQEIRTVSKVPVTLMSLDDWWLSSGKPDVSFIKIDTQGSELDILQGAPKVLDQVLGLEVEVEFNPVYQGQALFHQIDAHLRERGFRLWRLKSLVHYCENPRGQVSQNDQISFDGKWVPSPSGSGRLFWGDAIYFRDYRDLPLDTSRHLLLAAFLEASGDVDGAQAALRMFPKVAPTDIRDLIARYFFQACGERVS